VNKNKKNIFLAQEIIKKAQENLTIFRKVSMNVIKFFPKISRKFLTSFFFDSTHQCSKVRPQPTPWASEAVPWAKSGTSCTSSPAWGKPASREMKASRCPVRPNGYQGSGAREWPCLETKDETNPIIFNCRKLRFQIMDKSNQSIMINQSWFFCHQVFKMDETFGF